MEKAVNGATALYSGCLNGHLGLAKFLIGQNVQIDSRCVVFPMIAEIIADSKSITKLNVYSIEVLEEILPALRKNQYITEVNFEVSPPQSATKGIVDSIIADHKATISRDLGFQGMTINDAHQEAILYKNVLTLYELKDIIEENSTLRNSEVMEMMRYIVENTISIDAESLHESLHEFLLEFHGNDDHDFTKIIDVYCAIEKDGLYKNASALVKIVVHMPSTESTVLLMEQALKVLKEFSPEWLEDIVVSSKSLECLLQWKEKENIEVGEAIERCDRVFLHIWCSKKYLLYYLLEAIMWLGANRVRASPIS